MEKSIQQIMLGKVCGTQEKAAETLKRLRLAGYTGIELNRFMIHPSSLFVRILTKAAGMPTGNTGKLDWKTLIKDSGLSVTSLHTDLNSLEKETEAVIEEAKAFHTSRIVITGMYRFDYSDEAAVRDLALRLNKAGKLLHDQGLALFYHNHNAELLKVDHDRCAFDILIEETDPELVFFEFDSYWFTDGGADADAWMKKLGKRMKLWHINDRGTRPSESGMTPILKADSMELGMGNMNLDRLLETAEENGIEAAVLESHRHWIGNDPIRSAEESARWLNRRIKA